MDARTCPHCNYKYSRKEYVMQLSFERILSVWKCKNCHKKLTVHVKRRLLISLGAFGLFVAIAIPIGIYSNLDGMTLVGWFFLIVLYMIVHISIYPFDAFKKA